MPVDKDTPAWVVAKVVRRTHREIVLRAVNRRDVEVTVYLPKGHIHGERECRSDPCQREFLVPQWWAYRSRLVWWRVGEEGQATQAMPVNTHYPLTEQLIADLQARLVR